MTVLADSLGRADSFRFPSMAPSPRGLPRQEWHHFIVYGDRARIILNLSIGDPEGTTDSRPVTRLIVMIHHRDSWSGWIEQPDFEEVELGTSGLYGQFGESSLRFEEGGYDLRLRMAGSDVHGRLRFTPGSSSSVKGNQPLGQGRFGWLFVPRLTVDGHLWANGVRYGMRASGAYHDHNWGHFRWGDDFGWEWGSALGSGRYDDWSLVMWRMTDRGHLTVRGQGLTLWNKDEPLAVFRDSNMDATSSGLLRRAPRVTLPPVLALAQPGSASDVPCGIRFKGERGADRLDVLVDVADYGRIVIPSQGPGPDVVLHEASVGVEAWGNVGGRTVEMEGTGVFEFLR